MVDLALRTTSMTSEMPHNGTKEHADDAELRSNSESNPENGIQHCSIG
jgi:hypothetical protein